MKILYMVTEAEEAGAQKYVLQLAGHFHGTVAAGGDSSWLADECAKNGIPFRKIEYLKRNINPIFDLMAFVEIVGLILKEKPDLVHTNSTKAGLLGSLASKICLTKTVFTAHGFTFHEPGAGISKGLFEAAEKIGNWLRDYTITVSEADKEYALAKGLAKKDRVAAIHNGLSPINFLEREEAKSKLGLKKRLNAVTIANLYHRKGIDVLIAAAAKVKGQVEFTVIGTGPVRDELEKQVREANLRVKFAGQVPNAAQYLKAFDFFVLPSRHEAFPYVLLEALQAGLPAIASDVGGVKEILTNGLLVPIGDAAALASAIDRLAADSALRGSLGEHSLKMSAEFTLYRSLEATRKVYESLL